MSLAYYGKSRRRRSALFTGGVLAVAAALIFALIGSVAVHATTTANLKPAHAGQSNPGFANVGQCPTPPAGMAGWWGWHLLLPGNDTEFVTVDAHFKNAGHITTFVSDPNPKHAYVWTPGPDIILGTTTAQVNGPGTEFVLSHVCPGTTRLVRVQKVTSSPPAADKSFEGTVGGQSWGVTVPGGSTSSPQSGDISLGLGVLTITETVPSGWALDGFKVKTGIDQSTLSCSNTETGFDPATTVPAQTAATATNVLVCVKDSPSTPSNRNIRIGKVTSTATHPEQKFDGTITPGGPATTWTQTLPANTNSSGVGVYAVSTAEHTVVETPVPAGWTLNGYNVTADPNGTNQCSDTMQFSTAAGSNVVPAGPGGYLVCVKNTYTPPPTTRTIRVLKECVGGTGPTFTGTIIPGTTTWSATCGSSDDKTALSTTIQYVVAETGALPSGWAFSGYTTISGLQTSCTGGTPGNTIPPSTDNYTVCVKNTYTPPPDTRNIKIIKVCVGTDPANPAFAGTISTSPATAWSLKCGESVVKGGLPKTALTLTETTIPSPWILDGYWVSPGLLDTCANAVYGDAANVPEGSDYTVCVKNVAQHQISINVWKVCVGTDPSNPQFTIAFTGSISGGVLPPCSESGGIGVIQPTPLNVNVKETTPLPANWTLNGYAVLEGTKTLAECEAASFAPSANGVDLASPGTYTVCVKNTFAVPTGKVIVKKTYIGKTPEAGDVPDVTVDDSDTGVITAVLKSGSLGEWEPVTVKPGKVTVKETLKPGWEATNVVVNCTVVRLTAEELLQLWNDADQELIPARVDFTTIEFDVPDNATCTVTFTNEWTRAKIIVEKIYDSGPYTPTASDVPTVTIDGGAPDSSSGSPTNHWEKEVVVGVDGRDISISELLPAGWEKYGHVFLAQAGLACDSNVVPDTNTTINAGLVKPGFIVKLCIVNRAVGSVVVRKTDSVTKPSWSFTVTGPGGPYNNTVAGGNSTTGNTTTFVSNAPLSATKYFATENGAGVEACPAQNSDPNLFKTEQLTGTAGLGLTSPGQVIEFHFLNTKCEVTKGNLVVRKVRDNNGNGVQDGSDSLVTWNVTITGPEWPGGQAFVITGGTRTFTGIEQGSYTIVEQTGVPGWLTIGPSSLNATIVPNQTQTVTFFNQPRVNIQVTKTVVGNPNNPNGWTFTLTGCGQNQTGQTSGGGILVFSNLPPAVGCVYTVTESVQAGYLVQPSASQQTAPTEPGQTVNVGFTNVRIPETPTSTPTLTATTPATPTTPPTTPTPTSTPTSTGTVLPSTPPTGTTVPPTSTSTGVVSPNQPATPTQSAVAPSQPKTPIAPSAGSGLAGDGSSLAMLLYVLAGLLATAGAGAMIVATSRKGR